MWDSCSNVVARLNQKELLLTDEDKNWQNITSEEVGLSIVRCIVQTGVCELTTSRQDGYSLLHLAAQKGYPNMVHRLISLRVNPGVLNSQGETPLLVAIKHNQLECVEVLLKEGSEVSSVDHRGRSALHIAVEEGNVKVVNMLLTNNETSTNIDINKCDNDGYTPVYYAIIACRYDILQRFLDHSLKKNVHVNATNSETLLQFFTERNNLGQFDNALVRVLECVKQLHHPSKSSALMFLKEQLGTTEASIKAKGQLLAMYEPSRAQRHYWNFCSIMSCLILRSLLFFLDVYSDALLAVEYYNGFKNITTNNTFSDGDNVNSTANGDFREENEKTWNQDKTHFVLTLFFIVFPYVLLSVWSFYVHITQPDIIPIFENVNSYIRIVLYVLVFSPLIVYLENTYAQILHMNETTRHMPKCLTADVSLLLSLMLLQQADCESLINLPGGQPHPASSSSAANSPAIAAGPKTNSDQRPDQKLCKDKQVAQMRVAITNVIEATLESAFQLILQLYIVGTQYNDLVKVQDVTIGAILTPSSDGSAAARLGKQVFSVIVSLLTLTWSFTSYHRFFKLGGLTIVNSLPLLLAIFFQVVSRAIACTIFTLAYTWTIFVVLGVHFLIVLGLKFKFEERLDFYVLLGTISSTLVYFRLKRPSVKGEQLSHRQSTVNIQVLFLMLAFLENLILLSLGLAGLDRKKYDTTFKTVTSLLCGFSFIIGVTFHVVFYDRFGHPWADINGPKIKWDKVKKRLIVSYYSQGKKNELTVSLNGCCDVTYKQEKPHDETSVELPRLD